MINIKNKISDNKSGKNRFYLVLIYVVTGILLSDCSNNVPDTLNEYIAWFSKKENGFVKTQSVSGLNFSVMYRPKALMAINEIRSAKYLSQDVYDSLLLSYGESEYFMFEITDSDNSEGDLMKKFADSYDTYKARSEYMTFNINDDFYLMYKGDTIYPALYHHEKSYELASIQRFLFAFPFELKNKGYVTFIYDDKIFNTGRIKFKLNIDKKRIPEIPLKNI